jgi:WD40 repeat protein
MTLLWIALACSTQKEDSAEAPEVVVTALSIAPAEVAVTTGPDGAAPIEFTVTATLADGSTVALDEVEWSLSNRSAGTLDDGVFTPSATNGGVTYVNALFDGLTTQALVSVTYADEIAEEGSNPGAFRGVEEPTDGLWLYPQDGVNFPRNTPSIRFQWNDWAADSYKLRFRGATTDLTVYTTGTTWTASEALWATVVSTNAGGQLQVDLSAAVGGVVYAEEPLTLNVNRLDGTGSIYYWSTSASGIMEVPYGGMAREYLTYAGTGRCVGCHVISPQGLMALTYDGGDGPLVVRRISDGAELVAPTSGQYGNFKAFSPDGRFMVTTLRGSVLVYDGATLSYLWEVPVDGQATHVDWSPDGDALVFVSAPDGAGSDWAFTGGSIAVMDHLGDGTFGAPRVLYSPPSGYNAYYPVWSPDGAWVAFNVSYEDAYDDASAQLNVISRDGGAAIPLAAANVTEGLTNSWPRWGPLPDDDVLWLAFSSKRSYGNVTAGNPQIWVTAFDPERASRGEDPSWPAFWLPGQDSAQNNHIPVWAE